MEMAGSVLFNHAELPDKITKHRNEITTPRCKRDFSWT